jgi:hypothetical protein
MGEPGLSGCDSDSLRLALVLGEPESREGSQAELGDESGEVRLIAVATGFASSTMRYAM